MQLAVNLPEGVTAVAKLPGAGVFGEVYLVEDARGGGELPIRRIARLLNFGSTGEDVPVGFLAKLKQLARLPLLYVSPIHEVCERGGTLILLSPKHQESLYHQLGRNKGARLTNAEVETLIDQLLKALSELHSRGIVHGDVRPANIFLDTNPRGGFTAWLIDAAIGTLAHLTQGRMQDAEARYYRRAEVSGQVRDPSAADDLYALGLTLLETVSGREANPRRSGDGATEPTAMVGGVLPFGLTWSSRTLLLSRLLELPGSPGFSDATEALDWWSGRRKGNRLFLRSYSGLAAAVVLLFAFAWGASTIREQRQAIREQRQAMALQTERLVGQIKDVDLKLSYRLDAMQAGMESLKSAVDKPMPEAKRAPFSEARKQWEAKIAAKTEEGKRPLNWKQTIDRLKDAVERVNGEISGLEEESRPFFVTWRGRLKEAEDQLPQMPSKWQKEDKKLLELLQKLVATPWGPSNEDPTKEEPVKAVDLIQQWNQAFRNAARRWQGWANDPRVTFGSLKLFTLVTDKNESTILNDWLKETEAFAPTFKFVKGTCDKGWGNTRYIRIICGPHFSSPPEVSHKWDAPDEHDYLKSQTANPNNPLKFEWRPDAPLRVLVSPDRPWQRAYLSRPNIIDEQFTGPLAVWKASQRGFVQTGSCVLNFEIPECPGPTKAELEAGSPSSLLNTAPTDDSAKKSLSK